jgi:peptide/nickel transport system permease protein
MWSFILRRILYMIPLLWIISVVAFLLIWLQPGDFVTRVKLNPNFSKDFIKQLEEFYGLDQPAYVQYVRWLQGIVCCTDIPDTTDPTNPKPWQVWSVDGHFPFVHYNPYFGHSFEQRMPVTKALFGLQGDSLLHTIIILIATLLFAWAVAIPIGIYSATHKYSIADHSFNFLGFLGLSVPNFLLALLFIELMVVILQVGPRWGLGVGKLFDNEFLTACWVFGPQGTCGPWWNITAYNWPKVVNFLWHLWPVVIIVGVANIASLVRYMRGNLLDVLGEPYVQTARAKGLTEKIVVYKHAVRNAINPLISMLGFWIPLMFEGMIVTAAVLAIDVVELNYWNAISNEDQPVVMAGLLFFGVILLIGNLLADILLAVADPKIRYE